MMNKESDNKSSTSVGLNARSTTIIVVAILFSGILAGIFAGMFGNPGLFFDDKLGKCQKQCEKDNSGSDADSVSDKLTCQLGCY